MPKYLVPHTIEPKAVGAMLHPDDPSAGQLHLWEDQAIYYVVLSRSDLKNLARDIERLLKATPSPAGDPQGDRAP